MTGDRAFDILKGMTEDERRAVCVVWFDGEQLENLEGEDYEEKIKYFNSLTNAEKGEALEAPLYTPNGDIANGFDKFLDYYSKAFEGALESRMKGGQGE